MSSLQRAEGVIVYIMHVPGKNCTQATPYTRIRQNRPQLVKMLCGFLDHMLGVQTHNGISGILNPVMQGPGKDK